MYTVCLPNVRVANPTTSHSISHIRVQRSRFGSDANLPVIKITVHRLAA